MLSNSMRDLGSWGFLLNCLAISSTLHHGLSVFCAVIVASDVILPHLVHEGAVGAKSPAPPAAHLQIAGQSKYHISLALDVTYACLLEKENQR